MKNILLAIFCSSILSCYANGTDSLFKRHQLTLSITNGMNQLFFNGPTNKPSGVINISTGFPFGGAISLKATYLPLYAGQVQLRYSIGVAKSFRIETGIGYLLSSYLEKTNVHTFGILLYGDESYNYYRYTGSITLPIYFKYSAPVKNGAFTFTTGPDFNLPIHYYYLLTNRLAGNISQPDISNHNKYSTNTIKYNTTMGYYLKLSYEKALRPNLSVNLGPVIDFYQLVEFYPEHLLYGNGGYHPYQYYVGLDVAFNWGFKRR